MIPHTRPPAARAMAVLCLSLLIAPGSATAAPPDTLAVKKQLAVGAFEKVLSGGQLEVAPQYFHENYIQHNPQIPSGRAGLVSYLSAFRAKFPVQKAEVQRVVAEGDLVTIYSTWEISNPQTNVRRSLSIADLFRVEGGKLMEHWDVIQVAPN
jgi:predicted SnoaL-like aldol condensation-catalyzing enzyme